MKILESINISKSYNLKNKCESILKNVNLTVNKGEFVIIYGASGSGKTTFLNILSGLSKPTSGKVIINNKNYSDMNTRLKTKFRGRYISYVFQNYGLIPLINVLDNVMIGAEAGGFLESNSLAAIKKRAINILKSLRMDNFADRFPSELSGGQQQRVSIARALIKKPLIIFADEPTGALDFKSSNLVIKIFKNLAISGWTIIMVTHDEKLKIFANKIVYIRDGEIYNIEMKN